MERQLSTSVVGAAIELVASPRLIVECLNVTIEAVTLYVLSLLADYWTIEPHNPLRKPPAAAHCTSFMFSLFTGISTLTNYPTL